MDGFFKCVFSILFSVFQCHDVPCLIPGRIRKVKELWQSVHDIHSSLLIFTDAILMPDTSDIGQRWSPWYRHGTSQSWQVEQQVSMQERSVRFQLPSVYLCFDCDCFSIQYCCSNSKCVFQSWFCDAIHDVHECGLLQAIATYSAYSETHREEQACKQWIYHRWEVKHVIWFELGAGLAGKWRRAGCRSSSFTLDECESCEFCRSARVDFVLFWACVWRLSPYWRKIIENVGFQYVAVVPVQQFCSSWKCLSDQAAAAASARGMSHIYIRI